jgi:hypothetical protein
LSIVGGNTGVSGVVSSLFKSWLASGANLFFDVVCGGIGISRIFSSLSSLHSPTLSAPSA